MKTFHTSNYRYSHIKQLSLAYITASYSFVVESDAIILRSFVGLLNVDSATVASYL